MKQTKKVTYLFPLIFVTSLFFMWGFAISMLDVLNKHFQDTLNVSKGQSGFIQLAVYGAYFLMALPAGYFMKRFGYRAGILLGLSLYAVGAFLFYPATEIQTYSFFLGSLFVIGCGLAIIETAANPYVTVLGKPERAAERLNLAQSFNGLGVTLGPLIGGLVLFSENESLGESLTSIQKPYLLIGAMVTILFIVFSLVKLPEIDEGIFESLKKDSVPQSHIPLFKRSHFVYGVIAQFFYVGAQAGIWGFFINFATDEVEGMSNQDAAFYLSGAMLLYTTGGFGSTFLMRYIDPRKLLLIYTLLAMLAILIVTFNSNIISIYALIFSCFCMSIMFPTIFALGITNLGNETKRGGSFMIMSIAGGAVIPPLMGFIADGFNTTLAFVLPGLCFLIVFLYAWKGYLVTNYRRL